MTEIFEAISDFMARGGEVLNLIFAVTLAMWTLILERQYYYRFVYPREAKVVLEKWTARADRTSWGAHQIRELMISETANHLRQSITMINTLVAICPLLGLLGTVTGMIEVFDVMAAAGNSNARAMASGVSKATIPTMAGMVASLSGLIFANQIELLAKRRVSKLADELEIGEGAVS